MRVKKSETVEATEPTSLDEGVANAADEDKGHRAFYHRNASWYADALRRNGTSRDVDEVNFGIYHDEGGTSGEMSMRWHNLQANRPPAARLECFEDAFAALASMPDVIAALGEQDGKEIQPEEFCALLLKLGFKDETNRTAPGEESEGETARLCRAVKEVNFDRLSLKELKRVVKALQIQPARATEGETK
jgi:hypothetical protein